jgi:glyoxylase-like metal-dependent hydrolase (beta-lactamase superfamily II)
MKATLQSTSFLVFIALGTAVIAQDAMTIPEFFEYRDIDFESIEIETETITPGLYVLFGSGGNVVASIGEQGVLIVDDQYPALAPKIIAAIRNLGGHDVDFVINTHWHFDHTMANSTFSEAGAWVVSHANSRRMMTDSQVVNLVSYAVEQPKSPPEGLPVITYGDRMQLHFNDEQIDLLHFGAAHTTGDTAVIFRRHNAVHMGDIFFSRSYPFIDADNGGSLDGVILFCEAVLNEIADDTVVIPGHGRLATYADLKGYTEMLRTIRDRIAALIADGATLDEVIAAKPTAEWDADWRNPIRLLNRAYADLTR